ncbi:MAG: alpha/beta hydrolase [Xenococcaceae cyanobacterium]
MSLDVISIPPANGNPPTRLLVTLHGWGANSQDLAPLASMFNLPDYQFIFPNAPFPHPQVPWGRAWYSLETSDYHGLSESRQILLDWLLSLESTTGVPLSHTILSGFSQGGAMTLDVGLNLPLAGLCSLSGYLHSKPQATSSTFPPVLIVHGKQDPVVPLKAAQQARDELTALGVAVEYKEFDMGHEIQPAVLALVRSFIWVRQ